MKLDDLVHKSSLYCFIYFCICLKFCIGGLKRVREGLFVHVPFKQRRPKWNEEVRCKSIWKRIFLAEVTESANKQHILALSIYAHQLTLLRNSQLSFSIQPPDNCVYGFFFVRTEALFGPFHASFCSLTKYSGTYLRRYSSGAGDDGNAQLTKNLCPRRGLLFDVII